MAQSLGHGDQAGLAVMFGRCGGGRGFVGRRFTHQGQQLGLLVCDLLGLVGWAAPCVRAGDGVDLRRSMGCVAACRLRQRYGQRKRDQRGHDCAPNWQGPSHGWKC